MDQFSFLDEPEPGRDLARRMARDAAGVAAPVVDHPAGTARRRGSLAPIALDLASLARVGAAAKQLLHGGGRLDALIANAGVIATPAGNAVDGSETQFRMNHPGHFARIDRTDRSSSTTGRVVLLSTQAHRVSDVDLDDPTEKRADGPFVALADRRR